MTPVPDLLETIISKLTFIGTFTAVSTVNSNTILTTCCTGHARPRGILKINGIDYQIINVITDTSIEISGTHALSIPDTFTIDAPIFFHGTVSAEGSKIIRIKDDELKYPMVYLYEPFIEVTNRDETIVPEREAQIRLFFMDVVNFEDWDTDEHYLYAINPMRSLAERFIKLVNGKVPFGKLTKQDTMVSHAKIGMFLNEIGHKKNMFSDFASGIELKINLPILKEACKIECEC